MGNILEETDLTYPLYAPIFGFTAQDITVELYCNGTCVDKKRLSENFRRQIRVNFQEIKADEVKITVNKTSGEDVAVLNEVKVY